MFNQRKNKREQKLIEIEKAKIAFEVLEKVVSKKLHNYFDPYLFRLSSYFNAKSELTKYRIISILFFALLLLFYFKG
jgi:hypothetical protein